VRWHERVARDLDAGVVELGVPRDVGVTLGERPEQLLCVRARADAGTESGERIAAA
jgi:hypothetical protein